MSPFRRNSTVRRLRLEYNLLASNGPTREPYTRRARKITGLGVDRLRANVISFLFEVGRPAHGHAVCPSGSGKCSKFGPLSSVREERVSRRPVLKPQLSTYLRLRNVVRKRRSSFDVGFRETRIATAPRLSPADAVKNTS